MSETTEIALTTATALDLIAHERAPRYPGRNVNRRVECADGYLLSVQASPMHYAEDSSGEAPYWKIDPAIVYPFTSFELGNPSNPFAEEPLLREGHEKSGESGVCPWVSRDVVAAVLNAHGGAVAWESGA